MRQRVRGGIGALRRGNGNGERRRGGGRLRRRLARWRRLFAAGGERQLSLPLRNLLEAEPDVSAAYEARRKACKGRNLGIVAEECESNDKALMEEIVRFVQSGAKLPRPPKMP